ncbi:MAG: hypothetical protein IKV67_01470 [Paludibacteraceae bacterium]|nr:hypothetical protein [Paludibacteraceae bacterium]
MGTRLSFKDSNVMGIIQEKLATGNAKIYYDVVKEFEAVGTIFSNWDLHYTAAHPQKGLWLCGNKGNNVPIVIGFVRWENISRIIIDNENETVFVVMYNQDEVLDKADFEFKKLYKKAFLHRMSDTGEMSICLPIDLFSEELLNYLNKKNHVEFKKEDVKSSIWMNLLYGIVIIVFVLGLLSKFGLI